VTKSEPSSGPMKVIANVRVGRADIDIDKPSHVRGVYQGNKPHLMQRHKGIEDEGDRARATDRRSTGIRPKDHTTIDPRMPKLTPA